MGSTGSERIGARVLAALVMAACTQPTGSSASAALATATPGAIASLEPTATATSEPTAEADGTPKPCPTGKVLTVVEFVRGGRRGCFRDEDIRIRGWLDDPTPMGFEGPQIEPTWLAYADSSGAALWSAVPEGEFYHCPTDEPNCRFFFPRLKPSSGLSFLPLERWVILTGHLQDPAAEDCHFAYPDDWEGGRYDDADAVRQCRQGFVVTAIKNVD